MQNVEDYFLKIRHDVVAQDVQASNAFSTGFLMVNGLRMQLHCAVKGACAAKDMDSEETVATCNKEECWSTKYADYLSMKLVLRAAKVDLDSRVPLPSETVNASDTKMSLRLLGASVSIDIEYENVQPAVMFPFRWRSSRSRYTYTFRKMSDYASEADLWHMTDSSRKFIRKAGIKIFVNFSGELASSSWLYTFKQLAILQVLGGLAIIFVNQVMLFIYGQFKSCKHLPAMKHYYGELLSPTHADFKKCIEEEDAGKKLTEMGAEVQKKVYRDIRAGVLDDPFGVEHSSQSSSEPD